MKKATLFGLLCTTVFVLTGIPAGATLTLTPAGIADGFTLSTFVTLNPGQTGGFGPFGVAVASNGNVLVYNDQTNLRYVFADVDNQTTADALASVVGNTGTEGYATAGGQAYGGQFQIGPFAQYNPDGTINHVLTGVPFTTFLGMWGAPDGHIIATTDQAQVIDINPLANGGNGSATALFSAFADGVSVSPDNSVIYAENGGNIDAYNRTTGTFLQSYGGFPSPDGTGVIASTNALNGQVIVNDNFGSVYLLNPANGMFVAIATGGTRGDYVAPDTNNGTLFLDYSEAVFRLSCGANCSIGGPPPPPPAPEPASFILMGSGLLGLSGIVRKKLSR